MIAAIVGFTLARADAAQQPAPFTLADDAYLGEQWALFNWGQLLAGEHPTTANADLRAPEAWSITTGSPDLVVAVIDSGVDYNHPDLESRIWTNPGETGEGRETNGVDDDGNGLVDDWRGWDWVDGDNDPIDIPTQGLGDAPMQHGTAVASIIGAAGDDAFGMTGVAPEVQLMPLRVIAVSGILDTNVAAAIDYAAANGAQIVNLSLGTFVPGFGLPLTAAAIEATPNVLFVAAAGNDGRDADVTLPEPCSLGLPNLICVAATDQHDELLGESNFGATTVHLAAPGHGILVAQTELLELFADGFEDFDPARYVSEGGASPWAPSETYATNGSAALTDSPEGEHPTDAETTVRLADPIELTGLDGCRLEFSARTELGAATNVLLETSTNGGATWNIRGGYTGTVFTNGEWQRQSIPLEAGLDQFQFGFRLIPTAGISEAGDGIYLDDVAVRCLSDEHGDRDYAYASGTSFSTPHVAGVAALLLAVDATLDAPALRDAILEGAHPLETLEGRTVTGARLDAYGALLAIGAEAPTSASSHNASEAADRLTPAGGLLAWILPSSPQLPPGARVTDATTPPTDGGSSTSPPASGGDSDNGNSATGSPGNQAGSGDSAPGSSGSGTASDDGESAASDDGGLGDVATPVDGPNAFVPVAVAAGAAAAAGGAAYGARHRWRRRRMQRLRSGALDWIDRVRAGELSDDAAAAMLRELQDYRDELEGHGSAEERAEAARFMQLGELEAARLDAMKGLDYFGADTTSLSPEVRSRDVTYQHLDAIERAFDLRLRALDDGLLEGDRAALEQQLKQARELRAWVQGADVYSNVTRPIAMLQEFLQSIAPDTGSSHATGGTMG